MFKEGEPRIESSVLDRETLLSIEEIAKARGEEKKTAVPEYRMREYDFNDVKVAMLRKRIPVDELEGKEHEEEVVRLLKSKKEQEISVFEELLVNAFIEQTRIAKKFGLPEESVYTSMKLDFRRAEDMMMDQWGDIFALTLAKHTEILKKMGANDEDIITEVSGHIFHESIHINEGGLGKNLLGGKGPLGEVTSITGQLAYYLEKGYRGPKAYDAKCSLQGQKKAKEGNINNRDYDVATSVSGELLLEQLMASYPEVAEGVEAETSFDVCQEIVAKLSEAERTRLITCLKKAIAQSTDEKKFKEVIGKLKQEYKVENNS